MTLVPPMARVLSEGDKRDSKSRMPDRERCHNFFFIPLATVGRSYFAPEPASRTRPRRTLPTLITCLSSHQLLTNPDAGAKPPGGVGESFGRWKRTATHAECPRAPVPWGWGWSRLSRLAGYFAGSPVPPRRPPA
ncbi:hypothetical protein GGR53DRAFT_101565 [Hypoxylon sp. FL1150]|nr:hypothetical protein GGR53DRAFT_101565 [Hypoxylon sp. FL1150]